MIVSTSSDMLAPASHTRLDASSGFRKKRLVLNRTKAPHAGAPFGMLGSWTPDQFVDACRSWS
ncbi:MAG: hypothetical protein ACK55O_00395, partial [Phycisphaerales bacterium]